MFSGRTTNSCGCRRTNIHTNIRAILRIEEARNPEVVEDALRGGDGRIIISDEERPIGLVGKKGPPFSNGGYTVLPPTSGYQRKSAVPKKSFAALASLSEASGFCPPGTTVFQRRLHCSSCTLPHVGFRCFDNMARFHKLGTMTQECLYLAYGSNLHPVRLKERVPSARLAATVSLGGHQLFFHKRSSDASGKCNLFPSANPAAIAYGAIYAIAREEKPLLDEFEGCGRGYESISLTVQDCGRTFSCFTYSAQKNYIDPDLRPYSWYKDIVLLGAEYHQFPGEYIQSIEAVSPIPDPDPERYARHAQLIERIKKSGPKTVRV